MVLGTVEGTVDTGYREWYHRPGSEAVDIVVPVPMWYQHWAVQAGR